MNTQISRIRSALFAVPVALFLFSTTALSHDVIGADGKPTHQHVYKSGGYGNNLIAGHAAKPAGSNGIVIWQSAPSQSYATPQVGVRIPRDPFSKKDPKHDAKNMYKQKPAFSKNQTRTPKKKPQ